MNSGGPNYDDLPVVEDLSGVKVDDEDVLAVRKRLQKAKKLKSAIKAAQVRIKYCFFFTSAAPSAAMAL